MAITINTVKREFSYNGMTLADPGTQFTPDQVRDMYTAQYPELTTAAVEGPGKRCVQVRACRGRKGQPCVSAI